MRTLSSTLEKAQKAYAKNAIYKVVLTKGASTYTYERDRILPSAHDEAMYSQRAEVILDNADSELDDKDLQGYDAVISYGVISSAGEEYSATAPLVVTDQQFDSDPNKLTCTLILEGIPNLMNEDEASEAYLPEDTDTNSVKTLVNAVCGATLAPFTHCQAYEVVWDSGYDALADTYKPKDGFRIYSGGSRLAALRRLLDYTANVPRFEADGKIHILKPVTTGETYDYEYSLQKGDHVFFSKAYRNSLVFPNKVTVSSRDDDSPQYSGSAQVDGYDSLPAKVKKTRFVQARLASNDEAEDIAEALIAKAEMGSKRGQAEVPLNVGAEVFDYVKVTDSRQGDTRTGNLGYVHRRFGKDKWTMTFGFGNWLDSIRYNQILKDLETYTDAGQSFERLSVGDLYAEHILADNMDFVWIDPDNTIDLSQIGDNLDNLPDGETYVRTRSMHLDASGVYIEENTLYSLRVPGEADKNLTKGTTAPADKDTGDIWIDTSGASDVPKMWDGSTWQTLTSEQLDALNRGSVFTRVKKSSLTADGLVVLDNVQVGTYGLVKSAALSAEGLVLTDEIVDGTYSKVKASALTAERLIFMDSIVDGDYGKVSVGAITVDGEVDLSKSGVINKIATYITETSTRKWAAEHGADITGDHTADNTNNVGSKTASQVADGIARALAGLNSIGEVNKTVPGQYIVLDGDVVCTGDFAVAGKIATGDSLYAYGQISAGGGNVILSSSGLKVVGSGELNFYYSTTKLADIGCTSGWFRIHSLTGGMEIESEGSAGINFDTNSVDYGVSFIDCGFIALAGRTSAPSSPFNGMMVFNYSTGYTNVYFGGAWHHFNRDSGWA